MAKTPYEPKTKPMQVSTYGEFLVLIQCARPSMIEEVKAKLEAAECPEYICQKKVPTDLNTITYGQLDDLSRIGREEEPASKALNILLGIEPGEVMGANVFDVFGFMSFLRKELERINGLFNSIKSAHSAEEVAAGVEELNFGTFGVIDWYAKRMGITNQDEVFKVAWIRIYTCMKNDNEQNEYERRLNKQYMNRSKRRHG